MPNGAPTFSFFDKPALQRDVKPVTNPLPISFPCSTSTLTATCRVRDILQFCFQREILGHPCFASHVSHRCIHLAIAYKFYFLPSPLASFFTLSFFNRNLHYIRLFFVPDHSLSRAGMHMAKSQGARNTHAQGNGVAALIQNVTADFEVQGRTYILAKACRKDKSKLRLQRDYLYLSDNIASNVELYCVCAESKSTFCMAAKTLSCALL